MKKKKVKYQIYPWYAWIFLNMPINFDYGKVLNMAGFSTLLFIIIYSLFIKVDQIIRINVQ